MGVGSIAGNLWGRLRVQELNEVNLFTFLVISLATWRASSLLVNEKGPMNIFERFRDWAGIEVTQLGDRPEYYKAVPDTFLAQILDCVWCCSVWVALFWVAFYYLAPILSFWFSLPMAISALAIVIDRYTK